MAPSLILADEPTGNLDSESTDEVLAVLDRLNGDGRTIVVITHEDHVVRHARRRVEMRDGLVIVGRARGGAGMTVADVMRSALRGLSANKLRSSLTMLGILIGVAAVILLVAVGNGSAVAIQDRLQALGTNTLTVSANSGPGALGGARARTARA